MKKLLRFLFLHFIGRYFLFAGFALTGVFSQYGTIEFLSTDWRIFEITASIGVGGLVLNFIVHVIGALITNIRKPKK